MIERVLSACEEIQKTRPMIVVAQQQKKYGEKSKKFLEVFLHFMSNFLDSQHSNYMTVSHKSTSISDLGPIEIVHNTLREFKGPVNWLMVWVTCASG